MMGRRVLSLGIATAMLTLAACSKATSPYEPAPLSELTPPDPTTVRPGDVVVIAFWQQPDVSGELIVDDNGMIRLPLLHDVKVAGISALQIRDELTERYRAFYSDPLIIVNIKLGVMVTGAVREPGRFLADPGFTIFDALGMAGGEGVDAKRKGVILYREGKAFEINLNEAALATSPDKVRLQSGDWLYVPTNFWSFARIGTYLSIVILALTIANFFVK